jgi:tetratricopeptide (TPR) repeat protein
VALNRHELHDLYSGGLYSEVLERLMSSDVDPHEDPELAYYTALCHTRLEDWNQALGYFRIVVDQDNSIPRVYQSRLLMGYIYNRTGHYQSAEFQMNRLLEDGYHSPQIYANLGYSAWSQGLHSESLEHYRKVLDIHPDDPNALNAAGYILADQGKDLAEAVQLCKKAVEQKPDNPNYLDSLGWACFKTGDAQGAWKVLSKAVEQSSDDVIKKHWEAVKRKLT